MTMLAFLAAGWAGACLQDFEDRRLATAPEGVEVGQAVFSSNGREVAFLTTRITVARGVEHRVLLGDWQSPPFEPARLFGLSADGRRVLYFAGREEKDRFVASLFVNDKVVADPQGAWQFNRLAVLSANGQTVAYTLVNEERKLWAIGINGKRGKEHPGRLSLPALSADGKVVAYAVEADGKAFVMVGEAKGPAFKSISDPALSADGKTVAYWAEDDRGECLVSGDKRIPVSGVLYRVFLSTNGTAVGCVVGRVEKDGEKKRTFQRVQVGEKIGPEYSSVLMPPVFSPDGKTVAYGAMNVQDSRPTETFVVIGDRKVEAPNLIGAPVFSPDGRRVGYGAQIGRELWWKVIKVE